MKPTFQPTSPRQGFILLEIVLAVAILATALVALSGAISQCLHSARAVDGYTIAQTLIERIVFELDEQKAWQPGVLEGEFEDVPGFWWRQEILESDRVEETGLYLRILQVGWSDRAGQVSETAETFLYLSPAELEDLGFTR